MFGFVLRRLGMVVPTFLGITVLVFSLIHLIPGNVVEAMSGERGMEPERYARLMHQFGLDRPRFTSSILIIWAGWRAATSGTPSSHRNPSARNSLRCSLRRWNCRCAPSCWLS